MGYFGSDSGKSAGIFFFDNIPHKRDENPKPAKPSGRKPAEVIAVANGHQLVKTWQGSYYDKAPTPHGWRYLGKYPNDRDAVCRWRGLLRSEGCGA